MTHATAPIDVLIAGGGVAALEAALALRALAAERASVELLSPEPVFWYRPLAVVEPFHRGHAGHFALPELAAAAGATFSLGALSAVDAESRIAITESGGIVPYGILLIAAGAEAFVAIPGSLTFRGPTDTERVEHLLGEISDGSVRSVAFVVPPGNAWTLPVYELALMTAAWSAKHAPAETVVGIVTPEAEPLQLFGPEASAAVRTLLDSHRVGLHCDTHAREARTGELLTLGGSLEADRVVASAGLRGRRIDGIPQDADGFIDVDAHCRVVGVPGVYAAGDVTSFPVKQGGIAAQQALAAAEAIAADAGAHVVPKPFRPVLRGLLLTESEPRYLRHEFAAGVLGETTEVATDPLWWPPAKIVGKHLAPFLGALAGVEVTRGLAEGPGAHAPGARFHVLE